MIRSQDDGLRRRGHENRERQAGCDAGRGNGSDLALRPVRIEAVDELDSLPALDGVRAVIAAEAGSVRHGWLRSEAADTMRLATCGDVDRESGTFKAGR
jgi:hypothetical protein